MEPPLVACVTLFFVVAVAPSPLVVCVPLSFVVEVAPSPLVVMEDEFLIRSMYAFYFQLQGLNARLLALHSPLELGYMYLYIEQRFLPGCATPAFARLQLLQMEPVVMDS